MLSNISLAKTFTAGSKAIAGNSLSKPLLSIRSMLSSDKPSNRGAPCEPQDQICAGSNKPAISGSSLISERHIVYFLRNDPMRAVFDGVLLVRLCSFVVYRR